MYYEQNVFIKIRGIAYPEKNFEFFSLSQCDVLEIYSRIL